MEWDHERRERERELEDNDNHTVEDVNEEHYGHRIQANVSKTLSSSHDFMIYLTIFSSPACVFV